MSQPFDIDECADILNRVGVNARTYTGEVNRHAILVYDGKLVPEDLPYKAGQDSVDILFNFAFAHFYVDDEWAQDSGGSKGAAKRILKSLTALAGGEA